jgi:hypothetical protein
LFDWLESERDLSLSLGAFMAEQAKGLIFLAKEDYLKGERFVIVGDFELTHCLYSTMVNDLGGICYPGMVVLPWDFEKELEPWETGDNPIILDPEVIEIDDSESEAGKGAQMSDS